MPREKKEKSYFVLSENTLTSKYGRCHDEAGVVDYDVTWANSAGLVILFNTNN